MRFMRAPTGKFSEQRRQELPPPPFR